MLVLASVNWALIATLNAWDDPYALCGVIGGIWQSEIHSEHFEIIYSNGLNDRSFGGDFESPSATFIGIGVPEARLSLFHFQEDEPLIIHMYHLVRIGGASEIIAGVHFFLPEDNVSDYTEVHLVFGGVL